MQVLRFLTCGCIGGRKSQDTPKSSSVPKQRARSNSFESDFYQPQNIIGHTGNIDSNPTVYYLEKGAKKQRFGHITTAHKTADNVGKEKVHASRDYKMTHDGYSKTTKTHGTLREWVGTNMFHKSRNKFVKVDSENSRNKLHTATLKHRNVKSRYK